MTAHRSACWAGILLVAILAVAAEAQQARRPYRIGVLNEAWAASHPTVEGLKAGLRELGLEEGRDIRFDIRFTEGNLDAMPVAAAALVKADVDLIFTSQYAATRAAKDATKSIPIVFTLVGDPGGRARHESPAAGGERHRCDEPPRRPGGEADRDLEDTGAVDPTCLGHT